MGKGRGGTSVIASILKEAGVPKDDIRGVYIPYRPRSKSTLRRLTKAIRNKYE